LKIKEIVIIKMTSNCERKDVHTCHEITMRRLILTKLDRIMVKSQDCLFRKTPSILREVTYR